MNTENYTIFDWKGDTYIESLTRAKAKKFYNTFMEGKENRIGEFQKLLGQDVNLNYSDISLYYIEYWLYSAIKKYDISKNYPADNEITWEFIRSKALSPLFRSIANDISIYIAEMWFIKYSELLRWEMMPSSGKLEGSNYPGIMGFPHAVKKYNYAIIYYIYMHIYGLITVVIKPSDKGLIRKYLNHLPEFRERGLHALPPIPDDLLGKIKFHP